MKSDKTQHADLFFVRIIPCNKSELDGLNNRFVYVPGIDPTDKGHYIAVFNNRREYAQCVLQYLNYSRVTYGQLSERWESEKL